jgi:hypothetical protein
MRRIIIVFPILLIGFALCSWAQKSSGIFYSTLHSKEGIYKRIKDLGDRDDFLFFKDINGDAQDDAIVIVNGGQLHGSVLVSLSDGVLFTAPQKMFTYRYQQNFVYPLVGDINGDGKSDLVYVNTVFNEVSIAFSSGDSFGRIVRWDIPDKRKFREMRLADINGDQKDDLLYYLSSENDLIQWYSCISQGDGSFAPKEQIPGVNGLASDRWLIGDVNGDRLSDIISCNLQTKEFRVYLTQHHRNSGIWLSGFGKDDEFVLMIYDVDRDGLDDLVFWNQSSDCNWWIAYSKGDRFLTPEVWIKDHRSAKFKDNVPSSDQGMLGTLDGRVSVSMIVSDGKWLAVDYPGKGKTAYSLDIDSWEARGFDLLPSGGTYNTGDSIINRKHIRMISGAGFTYVTLDITNGKNERIDSRAGKFLESIREWNGSLPFGQSKLYANIAMGNTREVIDEAGFFRKLNQECKRAWEEFYLPYSDLYYPLYGKPLLIHMLTSPGLQYVERLGQWNGERDYIDRFTNRWMAGEGDGACCGKANFYGWKIPSENLFHEEMMPVMPGFKNPSRFFPRNHGDYYRTHWMRVLEYQPGSVWVNSFNDVEYTGVEPSYHVIDQFVAHPDFQEPWTDDYGNRTDDFYWIMTYQYNHLFMHNHLLVGTYFREAGNDTIYEVCKDGWVTRPAAPVKTPVLLFPKEFRKQFNGIIVHKNYISE